MNMSVAAISNNEGQVSEREDIAGAVIRWYFGRRSPTARAQQQKLVDELQLSIDVIREFAFTPYLASKNVRRRIVEGCAIEFSDEVGFNTLFALAEQRRGALKLPVGADWYLSEAEADLALSRNVPDLYSYVEMGALPGAVLTRWGAAIPLTGLLLTDWDEGAEAREAAKDAVPTLIRKRRASGLPMVLADRRQRKDLVGGAPLLVAHLLVRGEGDAWVREIALETVTRAGSDPAHVTFWKDHRVVSMAAVVDSFGDQSLKISIEHFGLPVLFQSEVEGPSGRMNVRVVDAGGEAWASLHHIAQGVC